jgi:transcriptional regulator with XRE-family HTH domain
MSQLDLGLEAGVSARHISFIETGRARPSPEMVERIAGALTIPLRERNGLLLAAGFAPAYPERDLDDEAMAPVRAAIDHLLRAHEPYPALVVDRHWELLDANRPVELLIAGASPELLAPPANVLRLSLHPEGVAPRITNLGEWRAHILARLHRQALATGDPALFALHAELSDYPAPGPPNQYDHDAGTIAVPLRISTEVGELAFLSTATSFGAAAELTLSELAIEAFYPADALTAERLSAAAPR